MRRVYRSDLKELQKHENESGRTAGAPPVLESVDTEWDRVRAG